MEESISVCHPVRRCAMMTHFLLWWYVGVRPIINVDSFDSACVLWQLRYDKEVLLCVVAGQSRSCVQVQLCSWNGAHPAGIYCRGWFVAGCYVFVPFICLQYLIMILQRKEPAKKLTQKRAVIMEQVWQVASFGCFIHVCKCLSKNPHATFFFHRSFAGPFWAGGVHVWPLCQMQRSPETSQKPEGKYMWWTTWPSLVAAPGATAVDLGRTWHTESTQQVNHSKKLAII